MARNLAFHDLVTCIECGAPHQRERGSWRCWPCDKQVVDARQAAMRCVGREIKSGRMPKAETLICHDCGIAAKDYDHRSYLRPLDVTPVCRSCNLMRGPAIWRIPDTTWPHPDGRPCIDVAEPATQPEET